MVATLPAISVSWAAASLLSTDTLVNYRVWRRATGSGAAWVLIAQPVGVTTYTDYLVAPAQSYDYRLTAVVSRGGVYYESPDTASLAASNVIADGIIPGTGNISRAALTSGDGLTGDSSLGVYGAATNLVNYSDTMTAWDATIGAITITNSTTGKFNSKAVRATWASGSAGSVRYGFNQGANSIAVTPGTSYGLLLWLKLVSGSAPILGFSLRWFDSSWRNIGISTSTEQWTPTTTSAAHLWSALAPIGAAFVVPYISNTQAGSWTFAVDLVVQVEAGIVGTALTLSGNEQTDASRAPATAGDGLQMDGTTGIWAGATNKAIQSFPGAAATTNVTKAGDAAATLTKVTDATAPYQGASTTVWQLDNSAGTTNATAEFAGTASAAVHAGSIWAMKSAGTPTLSIAAAGAVNITSTGTYVRYQMTVTAAAGDALRITAPAGAVVRFTGAQLETGTTATPVIATNGASAARAASRAQLASSVINGTQGWAILVFRAGFASTSTPDTSATEWSWANDSNNFMRAFYINPNLWEVNRTGGGAGNTVAATGSPFAVGDRIALVPQWDSTHVKVAVNGGTISSVSATGIPTGMPSLMDLGTYLLVHFGDPSYYYAAFGTGTLAQADMTTINGWGTTPPTVAQLRALNGGAAVPAALYLGSTNAFITIDPPLATAYIPTNAATATRSAATLTLPSSLLTSTRFWAMLRFRPHWPNTTPPSATPTILRWWDGTVANRARLAWVASTGLWNFEVDASSLSPAATVTDTFALDASRTLGVYVDTPHSLIGVSLNAAAWQTAAYAGALSGLQTTVDLLEGTAPANGALLWLVVGTGDPTLLDRTKSYWTADTDPVLATIAADSPLAGVTGVWSCTTLASQSAVPAASSVSFAGMFLHDLSDLTQYLQVGIGAHRVDAAQTHAALRGWGRAVPTLYVGEQDAAHYQLTSTYQGDRTQWNALKTFLDNQRTLGRRLVYRNGSTGDADVVGISTGSDGSPLTRSNVPRANQNTVDLIAVSYDGAPL